MRGIAVPSGKSSRAISPDYIPPQITLWPEMLLRIPFPEIGDLGHSNRLKTGVVSLVKAIPCMNFSMGLFAIFIGSTAVLCALYKYKFVQEHERFVSFVSKRTDDEYDVRKQPIAVVQYLLDKHNLYRRLRRHQVSNRCSIPARRDA